jgi:hypothetical protein
MHGYFWRVSVSTVVRIPGARMLGAAVGYSSCGITHNASLCPSSRVNQVPHACSSCVCGCIGCLCLYSSGALTLGRNACRLLQDRGRRRCVGDVAPAVCVSCVTHHTRVCLSSRTIQVLDATSSCVHGVLHCLYHYSSTVLVAF